MWGVLECVAFVGGSMSLEVDFETLKTYAVLKVIETLRLLNLNLDCAFQLYSTCLLNGESLDYSYCYCLP